MVCALFSLQCKMARKELQVFDKKYFLNAAKHVIMFKFQLADRRERWTKKRWTVEIICLTKNCSTICNWWAFCYMYLIEGICHFWKGQIPFIAIDIFFSDIWFYFTLVGMNNAIPAKILQYLCCLPTLYHLIVHIFRFIVSVICGCCVALWSVGTENHSHLI